MKKEFLFEEAPLIRAISTLAIPTVIGMLVLIIYNLAAAFFIGQLKDPNQVAAVTITTPVFILFLSIGALFGIGGSSYISRLLGKKDFLSAKQVSAFACFAAVGTGILTALIIRLELHNILKILGASPNTYLYAKDYINIVCVGAPLIIFSFAMSQIARAEGAAKVAMIGMLISTGANIALDPVLILYMGMGIKGAAYAAVVANILSTLYYIIYFAKKSEWLSISPKYFTLSKSVVIGTVSVGIPAFASNILMSISNMLLNNYASAHGDIVVASLGTALRINMLPIYIVMGICQGVLPLIGYNYASGNSKRMFGTLKLTMIISVATGSAISLILFIFSPSVVRVFLDNDEVVKVGGLFLRIITTTTPFMAIGFMLGTSYQAMGKAVPALVITILRQGFVFIPTLIIANKLIGVNGIVLAQPVSDVISMILAVGIFIWIKKEIERKSKLQS